MKFDHWHVGDVYKDSSGKERECVGIVDCDRTSGVGCHGCPGRPLWDRTYRGLDNWCPGVELFEDNPPLWKRVKQVKGGEQEPMTNELFDKHYKIGSSYDVDGEVKKVTGYCKCEIKGDSCKRNFGCNAYKLWGNANKSEDSAMCGHWNTKHSWGHKNYPLFTPKVESMEERVSRIEQTTLNRRYTEMTDKVDNVAKAKNGIVNELSEAAGKELMELLKELRAGRKVVKNTEGKIQACKDKLAEDIKEVTGL